jgi:hypothetical protein
MRKLFFFFTLVFSFISCKNQENDMLLVAKMEQKNKMAFNQINQSWVVFPATTFPEVSAVTNQWKDWKKFESEWLQKPKTSISAFKLKVKNLVAKSDSLHLNVPYQFNSPQVRSRIVAMQTKILSLDTYFDLDVVPHEKVKELIFAINTEYASFYKQCEEIIVKNRIPVEQGEEKLISIKDTTRLAKAVNFDELELKDIDTKENK